MLNFGRKLDQIRIKKAKIESSGLYKGKQDDFSAWFEVLVNIFDKRIEILSLEGQYFSIFGQNWS